MIPDKCMNCFKEIFLEAWRDEEGEHEVWFHKEGMSKNSFWCTNLHLRRAQPMESLTTEEQNEM
jgi:hypothetical protein